MLLIFNIYEVLTIYVTYGVGDGADTGATTARMLGEVCVVIGLDYFPIPRGRNLVGLYIIALEMNHPREYVPLLNLMFFEKLCEFPLSLSSNRNLRWLYADSGKSNFEKFYIFLRSRPIQVHQYLLAALSSLIEFAVMNNNIRSIYHFGKIDTFNMWRPQRSRTSNENRIGWAFRETEPREHSVNALLNMKIKSLMWIGVPAECEMQFDRILTIILTRIYDGSVEILDKIKYGLTNRIIPILHICIFEMFDQSDNDTLHDLMQLKWWSTLTGDIPNCNVDMDTILKEWRTYIYDKHIFYRHLTRRDYIEACISIEHQENKSFFRYNIEDDFIPLFLAIKSNFVSILPKLLNEKTIWTNDYQNLTPIHYAMEYPGMFHHFIPFLRQMKRESIEENTVNETLQLMKNIFHQYPIYYAIKYNNQRAFDFFFDWQFILRTNDIKDIFFRSCLRLAVKRGHFEMYRSIISVIDPDESYFYKLKTFNVVDYFNLFSIAIDRRHTTISNDLLWNHPEHCQSESYLGITPFVIAALQLDTERMLHLLAHGARFSVKIPRDIFLKNRGEPQLVTFTAERMNDNAVTKRLFDDLFLFVYKHLPKTATNNLELHGIQVMGIIIQHQIYLDQEYEFQLDLLDITERDRILLTNCISAYREMAQVRGRDSLRFDNEMIVN